ncbi:MAG: hypothetical protein AB8B55_10570 [Mariniblastus sp.]
MIANYDLLPLSFKAVLLVFAVVLAWLLKTKFPRFLPKLIDSLGKISRRPVLCFLLIFGLTVALNFLCTCARYPHPRVHDEFSYLLGADTYVNGRLTNPTHPHWKHFETYHVISQPSYMSKYPPANAASLAVGQVLTGHPIVGSWLTMGLALAGLNWMLCGWMSRKWALIGTLLLSLNVAMIMAWGQTYWGGSVQMFGGTLLFGAIRRIVDPAKRSKPIWVYSIVFGLGASILAFSRPFEGLLSCVAAGVVLFVWLFKTNQLSFSKKFLQAFVPAGVVGAIAIAVLLANNVAVTGKLSKMPYSVHSDQYESTSLLIWSALPELPTYNLSRMEAFYADWVRNRQLESQTPSGYLRLLAEKAYFLWEYFPFIGGICLIPIFVLFKTNRWLKFALLAIGGVLLIEFQLVHSKTYPHYIAPIACLFYFVLFQGMRSWEVAAKRKKSQGIILPTVLCYSLLLLVTTVGLGMAFSGSSRYEAIEAKLIEQPGDHLVFVRYPEGHNFHVEMVFNEADIDSARVVWANELSPDSNLSLAQHFPERKVWIWDLGDWENPLLVDRLEFNRTNLFSNSGVRPASARIETK